MVCMGVTEALIMGLDYQTYSEHFIISSGMSPEGVLPSTREPEGMDALRVHKFGEVSIIMSHLISGVTIRYSQKVSCIAALHRLFMMTAPWGTVNSLLASYDPNYHHLQGLEIFEAPAQPGGADTHPGLEKRPRWIQDGNKPG